jgi:hypothetical protein
LGAALLLPAGAADDVSAGADDPALGEFAGGLSPPHAAIAPIVAMAARSATTAIFFIIVFSSEGPAGRLLCPSFTWAVNAVSRAGAHSGGNRDDLRRFDVLLTI